MGFKIKATGTENAINPTRTQKALDEKDVRIRELEDAIRQAILHLEIGEFRADIRDDLQDMIDDQKD